MITNYTVYMHISPSNKIYIGITGRDPKLRWGNGLNYKKNKYFYSAIQKYGWDNIEHKILYENLTKKEAEQKEKDLISQYKSNQRRFGYNISLGGDFSTKGLHCNLGIKRSEETKEKLSQINKGRFAGEKNPMYGKRGVLSPNYGKHLTEEQRAKLSKPVYQFDKKGNFIKKWFGIREASKNLNIDSGSISNCCNRKNGCKTAGGYIWSYYRNINLNYYKDSKIKTVLQIDNNGKIINKFDSLNLFAKKYNISKSRANYIISRNLLFFDCYWRYANE